MRTLGNTGDRERSAAVSLAIKQPSAISWRDGDTPMPKYVKLILACLLCLAVITGLVLLVRHLA